jgi:UDPglucose 6-dehydrogenase
MKTNIGIIGYGVVGKSVAHAFRDVADSFSIYDKYQESDTLKEVIQNSRVSFICVPTPCNFEQGTIDLSALEETIKSIAELDASEDSIFVIKSTVVPGTTRKYQEQYPGLKLAMIPEFLRENSWEEDAENPDRIIIGAEDPEVSESLYKLYQLAFPNKPIFQMRTSEAELTKYVSNCFLATKVIFANIIHEYAEAFDAHYRKIKAALTADHRIADDHLTVTKERGFGGKCFPKDLVSLIGAAKDKGLDTRFFEEVWNKNLQIRQLRDWEGIPGASHDNTAWVKDTNR